MASLCHKLTSADFAFVRPSEGMLSALVPLILIRSYELGLRLLSRKEIVNSYCRLFSARFEAKLVSNPDWQTDKRVKFIFLVKYVSDLLKSNQKVFITSFLSHAIVAVAKNKCCKMLFQFNVSLEPLNPGASASSEIISNVINEGSEAPEPIS